MGDFCEERETETFILPDKVKQIISDENNKMQKIIDAHNEKINLILLIYAASLELDLKGDYMLDNKLNLIVVKPPKVFPPDII